MSHVDNADSPVLLMTHSQFKHPVCYVINHVLLLLLLLTFTADHRSLVTTQTGILDHSVFVLFPVF